MYAFMQELITQCHVLHVSGKYGEFPISRGFVTPYCKTVPTIMSCILSFSSYCVILENKIRR